MDAIEGEALLTHFEVEREASASPIRFAYRHSTPQKQKQLSAKHPISLGLPVDYV